MVTMKFLVLHAYSIHMYTLIVTVKLQAVDEETHEESEGSGGDDLPTGEGTSTPIQTNKKAKVSILSLIEVFVLTLYIFTEE